METFEPAELTKALLEHYKVEKRGGLTALFCLDNHELWRKSFLETFIVPCFGNDKIFSVTVVQLSWDTRTPVSDEKLRKEIIKIYLLLGLAVLAIGFIVPTLAQEGNTIDPQVRKQIEELNRKYDEAFNANNAVAVAALFTVDGVETGPEGPVSGQPDIVQRYLVLFQAHPTSHISKVAQVYAIGSRVCAITEYSAMQKKHSSRQARLTEGYMVTINVRERGGWKIQMLYWGYK